MTFVSYGKIFKHALNGNEISEKASSKKGSLSAAKLRHFDMKPFTLNEKFEKSSNYFSEKPSEFIISISIRFLKPQNFSEETMSL